jgi:outer membrane immunogenic protein
MKKSWLKGVAIAALTAVGAVAAQAADLPTKKEAPAPIFVPPPFTWTGFYIGANVGGIWESGSRSLTFFNPSSAVWLSGYEPGGLGSGNAGVLGGGQAGYNWQSGAFVLGVETDFDGTSLSKSNNFDSLPFAGAGIPTGLLGDSLLVHAKASLDWLGTTRARVGFVATPDNRLMFYGTGGVAYGGGSANFSVYDANNNFLLTGNPSSSRVGWTVGAGVEYAITNNITIKGEYLYVDLGSSNFTTPSFSSTAATLATLNGIYASGHINYDASIFRVGMNYKF